MTPQRQRLQRLVSMEDRRLRAAVLAAVVAGSCASVASTYHVFSATDDEPQHIVSGVATRPSPCGPRRRRGRDARAQEGGRAALVWQTSVLAGRTSSPLA